MYWAISLASVVRAVVSASVLYFSSLASSSGSASLPWFWAAPSPKELLRKKEPSPRVMVSSE